MVWASDLSSDILRKQNSIGDLQSQITRLQQDSSRKMDEANRIEIMRTETQSKYNYETKKYESTEVIVEDSFAKSRKNSILDDVERINSKNESLNRDILSQQNEIRRMQGEINSMQSQIVVWQNELNLIIL